MMALVTRTLDLKVHLKHVVIRNGLVFGCCWPWNVYLKRLDFSARATKDEAKRFSAVESLTIVLRVGLMRPRSNMLTVVRSNPLSQASSSCDILFSFRTWRTTNPKAFSAPTRG